MAHRARCLRQGAHRSSRRAQAAPSAMMVSIVSGMPGYSARSWAASRGEQAPAASCKDCTSARRPQEHIPVSWCRDCTEAFRGGQQAPVASCRDCTAVWLPWERTRIDRCTDYMRAAAPPPNLGNIEKLQMRMLAGMDPGSYGPHFRDLRWWSPAISASQHSNKFNSWEDCSVGPGAAGSPRRNDRP
jgi:hypothetical protein